ncbi:hypothetical protein [Sphingomonas sp. GC_Shp_3]|uniref:hypothetical protein n=1 Tax=Sphingomonas sp. GC_Shp_3 TaxID=2937383 RepID=UPI002269F188|nr:hypothetical protein [Sphingomonas sp. GC_Shp_3]
MFKLTLLAAAAVASLAAAPSIAAPVSAGANLIDGAPVITPTTPASTMQRVRETRYCIIATVTGSIIPHKECRTRKDWIDLTGIDPLAKN